MTSKWKSNVVGIMEKGMFVQTTDDEDADEADTLNNGQTSTIIRRFCFESAEEKIIKQNRKANPYSQFSDIETDINDICESDDDDFANYVASMVTDVLYSVYFKGMIFFVIAINAIHIALQTVETISIPYSNVFFVIDNIIMGIFICEILLKWYSGFKIFWKDYWNILDFIVIAVLHLGSWLAFFSNTRLLRILRVVRAFRSLKTVTSLTGLSLVVETILQSIPDMANILLLFLIFMVVLSVVGVKLFGKFVPMYFGDPIKCMFSIFVCFTQDGWMQIFRNFEKYAEEDLFTYLCAVFFFIITILTAAFIIANLIVAVVTTNLDKAMKDMKEEQRNQRDNLAIKGDESNTTYGEESDDVKDAVSDVPITMLDDILPDLKPHQQNPSYQCDTSHLTTEKVENYLMLLYALECNLVEYRSLRTELLDCITEILKLNENAEDSTAKYLFLANQVKPENKKENETTAKNN